MNIGLRNNKKKRAFTLVELMLLLVILSLVIASSYSLITRRHRVVPQKASHGQYLCVKELHPQGSSRANSGNNDFDPTHENNNCYADESREIHLVGSVIVKQQCVQRCSFETPKNASYIYLQLVGGGGAGGNANYNPLANNLYKFHRYDRNINLVESGWAFYENVSHANTHVPKNENSGGQNYVTSIDSWGGATTFASESNVSSTNQSYPAVKGSRTGCANCYDETNDFPINSFDSVSNGSLNYHTSGITPEYVNKHFYFHATESRPIKAGKKGRLYSYNVSSGNLFDSDLFKKILDDYVIEKMFAYDIAGKGPSAPGFNISPYIHDQGEDDRNKSYMCVDPYRPGVSLVDSGNNKLSFEQCVKYAYNLGYLGGSSNYPAGRNQYCSLPLSDYPDPPNVSCFPENNTHCKNISIQTDSVEVQDGKPTRKFFRNTANREAILANCPLMHQFWQRSQDYNKACSGGAGGAGSPITSNMVSGFKYGFTPVLGVRWKKAKFLGDSNNNLSFFNYQINDYRPCNPNDSGEDEDTLTGNSPSNGDVDSIDFGCTNTNANIPFSAIIASKSGSNYTKISGNPLGSSNIGGTFKTGCSSNCYYTGASTNESIFKLTIGSQTFNAPAFANNQKPNIHPYFEIGDIPEISMKNVHYFVGGYPHGFNSSGSSFGNGVGVGFKYDGKSNISYNACIAPGVSARNNNHQIVRSLGDTKNNAKKNTSNITYKIFSTNYRPKDRHLAEMQGFFYFPSTSISDYFAHSMFDSNDSTHYKWFKDLFYNNSSLRSAHWMECYEDTKTSHCMKDVKATFLSNLTEIPSYGPWAFGLSINSNSSNNPAKDCLDVPLLKLASKAKASSEGEPDAAIMPGVDTVNGITATFSKFFNNAAWDNMRNTVTVPRAFGTPYNAPWKLTADIIKNSVVDEQGRYVEGGCPTQGVASGGNTDFDYDTYGDRLAFVGRTGFLLKQGPKPKDYMRKNFLHAPDGAKRPNKILTLDGEDKMGVRVSLNYYTHALSHGEPGKPGEYVSTFARSFTAGKVFIEPGKGGVATAMNPNADIRSSESNYGGSGGDTSVYIGCKVDGALTTCSDHIMAIGGSGGRSGVDEDPEYAPLHQTKDFISAAIQKLKRMNSINTDINGMRDDNIFPRCSTWAPNPWICTNPDDASTCTTDNSNIVKKYKRGSKTFIDENCYGNGGVLADDSLFAAKANLFDMAQFLGDNIQPALIGKGGDGGFVRDDCWIVPQYFEVVYLAALASSSGSNPLWGLYNNNDTTPILYNGLTYDSASTDAIGLNNPSGSGHLLNKYDATLPNNSGYVFLDPLLIYNSLTSTRSCRTWGPRYAGSGQQSLSSDDVKDVGTSGKSGEYQTPDGQVIKYRYTGYLGTSDNKRSPSLYATEIGATDGYPGAVFITW